MKRNALNLPDVMPFIMKWICDNNYDTSNIDLVTNRGRLRRLAQYPFNKRYEMDTREHFTFRLKKVGNFVVMDEIETQQRVDRVNGESDDIRRIMAQGFELENVFLEEGSENNIYTLKLTKIGRIRCFVASQVDGRGRDGELVEIKANRIIRKYIHEYVFHASKLFEAYLQCCLVGVPHLFIGFRNKDAGRLEEVKQYTLPQIEDECRQYWNKDFYLSFLNAVLSWALPQVAEGKVYHLEYWGGDEISLIEVPDPNHIPQDFIDHAERYSYGSSVFVPDIEVSELGRISNTSSNTLWSQEQLGNDLNYHVAEGAKGEKYHAKRKANGKENFKRTSSHEMGRRAQGWGNSRGTYKGQSTSRDWTESGRGQLHDTQNRGSSSRYRSGEWVPESRADLDSNWRRR
eukprot:sb/3465340/